MNNGRKVLATVMLSLALGAAVVGCSKKEIWRASRQMCVAHGGTYATQTQQCSFAAGTNVSAEKACQDQAGVYVEEWQRCRFDE